MLRAEDIKIVVTGHVDDGKSTLIGRLLYDTKQITQAKIDEVVSSTKMRGVEFEWSYLLDALQSERDQAVTIDTTCAYLTIGKRKITLIDAPGHEQFLSNAITAIAKADFGLLMIDANRAITDQTYRHVFLMHLLGIQDIIICVNKMDLVDYQAEIFYSIKTKVQSYIERLGSKVIEVIPLVAKTGENIYDKSKKIKWFHGGTLLKTIKSLKIKKTLKKESPLRLCVQDVYRFAQYTTI